MASFPESTKIPDALYSKGEAWLALKDNGRAVESFRMAADRFVSSTVAPKALFKIANIYYILERYDDAAAEYDEVAEKYPKSEYIISAIFNSGLSLRKAKKKDEAILRYERILKEYPKSALSRDAALDLGVMYEDVKAFDKAIAAYRFITANFPAKSQEAQYWIGNCYFALGDPDTAAAEYLKVLSVENASGMWIVTAKARAAECFEKAGKLDKAAGLYNDIIKTGGKKEWTDAAEKRLKALKSVMPPSADTTNENQPAENVTGERTKK